MANPGRHPEIDQSRRPFQFRLRTLFIAVAWVAIAAGVWRTFGPPWPIWVNERTRVEPRQSVDGMIATLVELVVFLGFMQIWRNWPSRTRPQDNTRR